MADELVNGYRIRQRVATFSDPSCWVLLRPNRSEVSRHSTRDEAEAAARKRPEATSASSDGG